MEKYHMRALDRQINDEVEIQEILEQGKFAVIAMCRDNEPYIVSLSYGYDKDRKALYIHTGQQGLKMDFIRYNPEVCATVIDDRGYMMGECSHSYRSVVILGKITEVDTLDEKKHGMEVMLNHLEEVPSIIRERSLKNDDMYNKIAILRLDITSITGKKGN